MLTLEQIDEVHRKALAQGTLVFRYIQGFNAEDDIGKGVCFALAYKWITLQLVGKLPFEGIVDRRALSCGIPYSTSIASRFPNLVQRPLNGQIMKIQKQSSDGFYGIRNQAGLDNFTCTTVAFGSKLPSDSAGTTLLKAINACHKELPRGFGMIGMRREDKKSGHAIAFQVLSPTTWRLFDPNLGEFWFKTGDQFGKNFRSFMTFMEYSSEYTGNWSILKFRYGSGGG